jgi:hypothetical protein
MLTYQAVPILNCMLTPAQLLAARAIVEWTRDDLAKRSHTSIETIKGFEWAGRDVKIQTATAWKHALQVAGVMFIDDDGQFGPGVRLRESASKQRKK